MRLLESIVCKVTDSRTTCRDLNNSGAVREKKKLGEVTFPAQVRSDTYYFYSAAYYYFGSVVFVAVAMPLKFLLLKTIPYCFSVALPIGVCYKSVTEVNP